MCSKNNNKHYSNYDKFENNRFSDGKHYSKKHKPTSEKNVARNNFKQMLRKEIY